MRDVCEYVSQGLALVDIQTGKGPATPGWNKRENVITDAIAAAKLKKNVGLAHAYSDPPTMALDIDDLPKAHKWFADHGIDLNSLLDADDAVRISSGRDGRDKLVYRLPADVSPIPMKQIADPETGDTVLEFRCATAAGLTVQDVLPPSIHPKTGKPYQWAGKGSWRKIPDIPRPLLAIWESLLKPAAVQSSVSGVIANDSSAITLPPETIQHLRSALLSMRADDYDLWIKMGLALKPLGDVGRGLWLEWSLTSEKSQDE
jgi:hypothetical protein